MKPSWCRCHQHEEREQNKPHRKYSVSVDDEYASNRKPDRFTGQTTQKHVQLHKRVHENASYTYGLKRKV